MSALKIIPLGGMGNVTQNMFVYEYENELLIVDCGIGFPDVYMPGVDVLIPDISYLLEKLEQGKKIIGMILSHGHDDHIGATPYILPELPEFPIYASALTAGFAQNRMKDGGVERTITVVPDGKVFELSTHFSAQPVPVTHSVPDTRHYAIHTPEGVIYHGSDFKLDPSPVDGQQSDVAQMAQLAEKGILCALVDCLRVERSEWTKSESTTGPVIDAAMASTRGKFIMTLMSSHIHRIQQTVDAAIKHNRKVVFVGRSVEQNVEVALNLGKLKMPREAMIDKRDINNFEARKLCVIIAGSQGQEGSSLVRAIYGEHPVLQITPSDKVVFSADAIPGNEIPYFAAIDELCRNGVDVQYPDVLPNLHQSGHASAPEQQELVGILKSQYVWPVGGADRHRVKFLELVAAPVGVAKERVLIPRHGEVMSFENGTAKVAETINIQARTVDGLGIGDVGPVVLSDRRALSQAGIIVVVIPRNKGKIDTRHISIVSRGFVFVKEAEEVIAFIQEFVTDIVASSGKKVRDDELGRQIERRLSKKLYQIIKREPVIVTAFVGN